MFIPVNIFGKKRIDDEKERQIRDLRATFPSLRRPNNDNEVFEIMFEIDRSYNTLRVYLQPDFPASKPVLQVVGPVTHACLDRYKQVTGCDKLNMWTKGSSLAEVVELALSTLQGGVNVFPQGAGAPSSTLPPPTTSTTSLNSLSAYPAMSQPQRPAPAYPAQIPSKMGGQNSGSTGLNPYPTLPSTSSGSTYSNIQSGQSDSNSKSNSPVPFTSQSHLQNNQMASTSLIASSNYQNIPPYQPSYDFPSPSHQFNPNLNPNLNTNTYSNTNSNSKDYQYQKHADLGSKNPSENDLNVHTLPLPEIPSEFREIRNLTTFQLEKLSKDEVAIQSMVRRISSTDTMGSLTQQLRASNQEQAERNLSKEDEMNQILEEVRVLQNKLKSDHLNYELKLNNAKMVCGSSTADVINQIEAKKQSLDDHSESVLKAYNKGAIDMTVFVQDYLDSRTNYHKISAKLTALNT